jgi:hypothetical protein
MAVYKEENRCASLALSLCLRGCAMFARRNVMSCRASLLLLLPLPSLRSLQCPGCGLTSEMPFLCILLYRVVHEILRGFLRWRKRDSVFPFWKRKILLSPRMKSLPCCNRQRRAQQLQRPRSLRHHHASAV